MSAVEQHDGDASPETDAPASVPRHVAIIMDGNSRWAQARKLPRKLGHQNGAEALKRTLESCRDLGIRYLTVYAFSSENWNRDEHEVSDLMELMRFYLKREVKTLHKNNIRIQFIGDRTLLSDDIQQDLNETEKLTMHNNSLHLTIALSYGSRQEIIKAFRSMAMEVANGSTRPEDIDDYMVMAHLDTANLPDPDLLIRTGGEKRLSNFLLWQFAYTELYFTETLWPDFSANHLREAIDDYSQRERRYGKRNSK